MPFGIFSSAALRRANIGAVTLFGTYVSFQFLVTQYLQTLSGWSPMSTALAFLPAGVIVAVLSTKMGSAVVDAGGAGTLTSAPAALAAYRPALGLITGIAAIGAAVALSGLRRQPNPEATEPPAEGAFDPMPSDRDRDELAILPAEPGRSAR